MMFPPVDSPHYLLTAQALLTGAAAFATWLLGVVVVVRERGSQISRKFCVMTCAVSLWLAAFACMYGADEARIAVWWCKIGHIGVLVIPAAVYHFTVTVLRITLRRRWGVMAGWALSGAFVLTMLSTDWLVSGVRPYWWGYYTQYDWLNLPFLAFFFGVLAAILRDYWRAYRAADPGSTHQRRTRAFLAAFGIGYLASADYLAAYDIPVYPFGYLPVFGFLAVAAHTIWRYHLADITPATAAAEIIDTISDALIVVDADGIVRLVNQAATQLLGYREGELVGQSASLALDGALSPEQLRALLQTGGTLRNRETAYYPKWGGMRTLAFSASVMRGRDTKPLAVVCTARDITDRKRAEEEIERLASFPEENPDAVVEINEHGAPTYLNPAACRQFPDLERQGPRHPLLDGLPAARPRTGESASVSREVEVGDRVYEEWISMVPHSSVLRLYIRDVTTRKRAEEALRNYANEVHDLYNKAPCGYHSLDRDGVIVAMNDTELAWLGYAHREVVGKKRFSELLTPESVALFHGQFPTLKERGWVRDLEFEMVRKDGSTFSILLNATAVTDEQGLYLASRSTVFDITDRKALEEQLIQAQKFELIGQLAAGIAHEINTPIQYVGSNVGFLQGIFSNLDRLLDGYERVMAAVRRGPIPSALLNEIETLAQDLDLAYMRQEVPKAVAQSLEGVERVSKIVRSVRELSHSGSPKKTPTDLNHMLERAIAMAQDEWRYVADLVTDFDPALPPVPCLPDTLQQAILNILVNAAQASAEVVGPNGAGGKGTITVSTKQAGPWAELRIRDTGKGIPRAIHPKIFSPFFTTKAVGQGTGQGLSIAHSIIVRQHGGTIRFETMEGRGTTFIIRLPIEASEDMPAEKGGEGDVASGVVRG